MKASISTCLCWPTGSVRARRRSCRCSRRPASTSLLVNASTPMTHCSGVHQGKCRRGRLWTYVRDDKPFGGRPAPALLFYCSPIAAVSTPEQYLGGYSGIMQADAYGGFNGLYV